MEERLELRHEPRHEAAILANAVSTHRRCARLDMLPQELECAAFSLHRRRSTRTYSRKQTRGSVLTLIPLVHLGQRCFVLMDRIDRPLGDQSQRGIGHERGNLDDRIRLWLQTGHFEIDPDEGIATRHVGNL